MNTSKKDRKDWSAAAFIEETVVELKQQLGDDKVMLALSGGVDSSVTAALLNRAIGKNLTCIFVDHGLLRKNEFENVLRDYEQLGFERKRNRRKATFLQSVGRRCRPRNETKNHRKVFY